MTMEMFVKDNIEVPLHRRIAHQMIGLFARACSKNKLNILLYHQVLDTKDPMRIDEPTSKDFYQQMWLLKKYYHPISLTRAVELLRASKLPANSVCVTFDDGYYNNLSNAAPILTQLDIPATVFVATSFSEGENMWNDNIIDLIGDTQRHKFDFSLIDFGICFVKDISQRNALATKVLAKIKYLDFLQRRKIVHQILLVNGKFSSKSKMMNAQQLNQIESHGIEVACHTVDHPILSLLNKYQQHEQIIDGKLQLEVMLNKTINGFAYPNGKWKKDYNEVSLAILKQAKFDYAVTTKQGISTPHTDFLQLNRYTPWNKDILKFHTRLLINTVTNHG